MSFKRILIAIDGSAVSLHAANVGTDLARSLSAEVATLFVIDPPVASSEGIGIPQGELLQLSERENQPIVEALRQCVDLPVAARHLVRVGQPAHVIRSTSADWEADLIVIGSHGRTGLSRLMLGSVAEAVVRHATCAVLVVRDAD